MTVNWQQDLAAVRGVTRWTAPIPVASLEEAVVGLGRHCVLLDGTDIEDRGDFFRLCEHAFGLPEWFGHNWDALEECLADLDRPEGVVVLWSDWTVFAEYEPDEYATALDVFADSARTLGMDGISFAVLLIGDDPADGILLEDTEDDDLEDDVDDQVALGESFGEFEVSVDEAL